MGWAFCGTDYYGREIGYGIEATCDKRGCDELIDRGLGCICGDMHHGPFDMAPGCGRYYCEDHRGWPGPRGGCRHKGKQAWGKTKCQLMRREQRVGTKKVKDRYDWVYEDRYYCACREWSYEGPALSAWNPRKQAHDPNLDHPRRVPGYVDHLNQRGFFSDMNGDDDDNGLPAAQQSPGDEHALAVSG